MHCENCNQDDDIDMMMEEEPEEDECISYDPIIESGIIEGVWTAANEKDSYPSFVTTPEDAGAGYYFIKLTQSDGELIPAFIVTSSTASGGAIISGSAIDTGNEQEREAYFAAHPGVSYDIDVSPFFNASEYPVSYTIDWGFLGKEDCFEPNDIQNDAKLILVDNSYEAFMLPGFVRNVIASNEDQTNDWYKIIITESGQYNFEISGLPNNMRLTSSWKNQNGSTIASDFVFLGASTSDDKGRTSTNTTLDLINPGTYFIEVNASNYSSISRNKNEPKPDHFDTPYSFIVKKL